MGRPLMPWQAQVARVATELNDDGTWAYGLVIMHVQRQAGKTTVCGPIEQHRCAIRPDGQVWVTAQSGGDARDIWMEVTKLVRRSPFGPKVKVREANGTESITWPNGATYRPFVPAEDSLHGKPTELVRVDESWFFSDSMGTMLEAAIMPTFTTTGGQLFIVSAGGTASSSWFLRHVIKGRAAVDGRLNTGIAYFEWAITEAEAGEVAAGIAASATEAAFQHAIDLILSAHPSAGFTLRRPALVTAARSMKAGEFLRAYGNYWTRASERVIPATLWEAGRRDPRSPGAWPPPADRVGLGFAASVDHRDSAIVTAWRDRPGGALRVDLVDSRPGTSWLAARVREIRDNARAWTVAAVGHDKAGPALDVADELSRAGVDLIGTGAAEYAAACAAFLRHVTAGELVHPGAAELDDAVAAAGKRNIGDGLWAFSRRGSSASIAALEAAVQAVWAYEHAPARSAPVVVTRRPAAAPPARRRRHPAA